jgi:hypothetical protein
MASSAMREEVLQRELARFLGWLGPWRWSRSPVNLPEIWNFCEAVEDPNPVYWDEVAARASRFGRLISPPIASGRPLVDLDISIGNQLQQRAVVAAVTVELAPVPCT